MVIFTMSKGVSVVNVRTDRLRGLVMGVDQLSTNRRFTRESIICQGMRFAECDPALRRPRDKVQSRAHSQPTGCLSPGPKVPV